MSAGFLIFLSLGVFTFNLTVQMGLGLRELYKGIARPASLYISQWTSLFLTTLGIWALFACVLNPLCLGFAEYFLVYPLSAFSLWAIDSAFSSFFHNNRNGAPPPLFQSSTAYSGLAAVSSLLCLHLASAFTEALCLGFAFAGGGFLSFLFLRAIHARSHGEKVPALARGLPLFLISAALLALITAKISVIMLGRN